MRKPSAASLAALSVLLLGSTASAATIVSGVAMVTGPLANATITVADANGVRKMTRADAAGFYSLDVSGMSAPLLISAAEAGNANCSDNLRLRGLCVAALLPAIASDTTNVANANPFTDIIVSDVSKALKLRGPQDLVDSAKTADVKPEMITKSLSALRPLIRQALKDAGVAEADTFDPVTHPMKADGKGVAALLDVLRFGRGYDNVTGAPGFSFLLDIDYKPVIRMAALDEPLDLKKAQASKAAIADPANTRVFVIGDSTASVYELERMPRMGWAQAFDRVFKDGAKVKVVDAAKSGRSTRDFYTAGFLRQFEGEIRPGDYMIIQFGHNDENCDLARLYGPSNGPRGIADVTYMCAYPNDAAGRIQGPDETSFQRWLEMYVDVARAKGATPILLTPTTRVPTGPDKKTGLLPITATLHVTSVKDGTRFAFVGDYSQTVRDAAKAKNVPLVDIDAKTIAFANAVGEPAWREYWLAADPVKYPYWKPGLTGTADLPDGTHFQEKGAVKVAELVAEGIKEHGAALAGLIALLK